MHSCSQLPCCRCPAATSWPAPPLSTALFCSQHLSLDTLTAGQQCAAARHVRPSVQAATAAASPTTSSRPLPLLLMPRFHRYHQPRVTAGHQHRSGTVAQPMQHTTTPGHTNTAHRLYTRQKAAAPHCRACRWPGQHARATKLNELAPPGSLLGMTCPRGSSLGPGPCQGAAGSCGGAAGAGRGPPGGLPAATWLPGHSSSTSSGCARHTAGSGRHVASGMLPQLAARD